MHWTQAPIELDALGLQLSTPLPSFHYTPHDADNPTKTRAG